MCPAARGSAIGRCNFSKSIGGGGGQRVKSAQGTIKILYKSDLFSDLNHFLAIIGGGGGLSQRVT